MEKIKLYKGILHTADFTEEMAKAEDQNYSEEEIKIITDYMQAWDGAHVTLSNLLPEEYSVVGWPPEEDEKVKNAIYLMEQDPVFGMYVDDRAICFDGNAKSLVEKIINFRPWNAKEVKK